MKELTHRWVGISYLPKRHGQLCKIIVARKGKYIIEFADGFRVVTVRGTFRKYPKSKGSGNGKQGKLFRTKMD